MSIIDSRTSSTNATTTDTAPLLGYYYASNIVLEESMMQVSFGLTIKTLHTFNSLSLSLSIYIYIYITLIYLIVKLQSMSYKEYGVLFENVLSFLLRCGTRPYERGTQCDSNSLV